jgi:hypothetical protein
MDNHLVDGSASLGDHRQAITRSTHTRGQSRGSLPALVVPDGIVASRIRQLRRSGRTGTKESPNSLQEWDRDSEFSGWGRSSQSQFAEHSYVGLKVARWDHSNDHGFAEEISHEHRSGSPHSTGYNVYDIRSAQRHRARLRRSLSAGQTRTESPAPPYANSESSADDGETKRRQTARELFAQYGVSRPSGWLSDEDLNLALLGDGSHTPREYCRICHVCSARTWSPAHCSTCGHLLCQRCVCEVPRNTLDAHRDFSHHQSPVIKREGSRYAPPSALTADSTAQKYPLARSTLRDYSKEHKQTVKGHAVPQGGSTLGNETRVHDFNGIRREGQGDTTLQAWQAQETQKTQHSPKAVCQSRAEQATRVSKLHYDTPRGRPTWSVKQNPFLIADRKASRPGKDISRQASCG